MVLGKEGHQWNLFFFFYYYITLLYERYGTTKFHRGN